MYFMSEREVDKKSVDEWQRDDKTNPFEMKKVRFGDDERRVGLLWE